MTDMAGSSGPGPSSRSAAEQSEIQSSRNDIGIPWAIVGREGFGSTESEADEEPVKSGSSTALSRERDGWGLGIASSDER